MADRWGEEMVLAMVAVEDLVVPAERTEVTADAKVAWAARVVAMAAIVPAEVREAFLEGREALVVVTCQRYRVHQLANPGRRPPRTWRGKA